MKIYLKLWLMIVVLVIAVLAMYSLPASLPAHAAGPWYVGPGGSDSNDCLSPTTRCASINGALNKPGFVAGDTIYVAVGTYTGSGNEVVLLKKNATLSGGWNASFSTQNGMSIIDGEGVRRGVTIDELPSMPLFPTVTVERFTIQNGSSGQGGGIYINQGNLTLNNSTVSNNTGRGIHSYIGSNLTLNNSTISNNIGGGVYSVQNLSLNNSTISGNTANDFFDKGGGIRLEGTASARLNSSTISSNTAMSDGGGIYDGTPFGRALTLRNTIIAGNTVTRPGSTGAFSHDCAGSINSSGYNLIGNTDGCTFTPTVGDLTNIEPKLGPLEGIPSYHPLLFGSPAINAGNPTGCTNNVGDTLPTDQRGAPRVGRCDIGAFEAQELETSSKTANISITTPNTPFTYTIILRNISS